MKKILVSNIFVGGYGHDPNNVPHEVINLFRADPKILCDDAGNEIDRIPGKFYVYITPSGVVNLQPDEIQGIIFVRSVGNKLVEVLAKAEGIIRYIPTVKSASKNKRYSNELLNDINYGGCNIVDLYDGNTDDYDVYVSFEVEKLCMPRRTFFLTNDPETKETDARNENIVLVSNNRNEVGKKINNQSERTYYDEGEESYNILDEVLRDENNWNDYSITPYYVRNMNYEFNDDNILKAALQQDNEVIFTNLLYYFLASDKELCRAFINQVLNIEINTDDIVVYREKQKMDISIICSDEMFIIIENKINSGINGLKYDENKNLIREDNKIVSQLSDYYKKALEKTQDENKIKAFVIHPNYVSFNLEGYLYGDKFSTEVKYSNLYEFFSNINYRDNSFLEHFVKALFKHSRNTNDEFVREMYKRLNNRLGSK